jgi:hypothetical protein
MDQETVDILKRSVEKMLQTVRHLAANRGIGGLELLYGQLMFLKGVLARN